MCRQPWAPPALESVLDEIRTRKPDLVFAAVEALPEDLIFWVNYLGDNMPTFALNFSRPGAQVVAQYYNFLRLGFLGLGFFSIPASIAAYALLGLGVATSRWLFPAHPESEEHSAEQMEPSANLEEEVELLAA